MHSLITFLKRLVNSLLKEPTVYLALLVIVLCILISSYSAKLKTAKEDLQRQSSNVSALFEQVTYYKTSDSLNAAQVSTLELSLSQYKKFREEDLRLIESLKASKRELQNITTTQSKLIAELQGSFHDTTVIILHDSIPVPTPARQLDIVDPWFELHGLDINGSFQGTFSSRDSLLFVSSYKYKRFLGFLWKTHKIKDKKYDVVSKNPYITIENVEYIEIVD